MKNAIGAVLLSSALAACGGGDSDDGAGGSGVVQFELDPATGPQCYGADDISTFKGSFSTTVDCTWHCADYKGRQNAYVSLDFTRRNESGATWAKDHEYISGGIC